MRGFAEVEEQIRNMGFASKIIYIILLVPDKGGIMRDSYISPLLFSQVYSFCRKTKEYARYLITLRDYESIIRKDSPEISIFNYKELAHPVIASRCLWGENEYYGIEKTLKSYAQFNKHICAVMEHGSYFGGKAWDYHIRKNPFGHIITFSPCRKEAFLHSMINVTSVGPYIHYAQDLAPIKKESRNIVFFPIHSTVNISAKYDFMTSLNKVRDIKRCYGYDKIFVCLYWKDIVNGNSKFYEEQSDVTIVSAGYMSSEFFLPRLKQIIGMADLTISNKLGTQLGYCAFLGKPHVIIPARYVYVETAKNGMNNEFAQWGEECMRKSEIVTGNFNNIFGIYDDKISVEQYNLCNEYWGFDQIKKPEELRELLEEMYEIARKRGKNREWDSNIKRLFRWPE